MTFSGRAGLSVLASSIVLAGCATVMIEEDPYAEMVDPHQDNCVLDISVSPEGRTIWKGEEISDEEFDRRLLAGRISEACIEPKKDSIESP